MLTGKQIRAARVFADWQAQDLAKEVGCSRVAIQNYERGVTRVKPDTSDKIVSAFAKEGIEFTENEGIRRRPEEIRIMKGVADFVEFHDIIYHYAQKNDGEICISGSDSRLYDKYRPNPEAHRKRMAELAKDRGKKFVRILLKEGDARFVGSEYATFRWQPPELFSPTTLYTFGDYLALISFYHKPAPHIILIHSKTYADAYKLAFEATWRNAQEPPNE
ncbi:MAG: helix-turn-helix transcriptional regulator [Alphaproteobacteria bacterium]